MQMIKEPRREEEEDKEKSKNEERPCQSPRILKRHSVKVTQIAYYSSHSFDRENEFSKILRPQRFFKQLLIVGYCMTETERMSGLLQNRDRLKAAN